MIGFGLKQGAVLGLTMLASDRLLGKKPPPPSPAQKRPPTPRFTEGQIAAFTQEVDGARVFETGIAEKIRKVLRSRSAVMIPDGGLVAKWSVCPLRPDAEVAADVIERAEQRGLIAVGSLTLALVHTGSDCPMLLVFVPERSSAVGAREFAILTPTPIVSPDPQVEPNGFVDVAVEKNDAAAPVVEEPTKTKKPPRANGVHATQKESGSVPTAGDVSKS